MVESQIRMKLLIDTVGKRVLFAEAGKDCVDLLFFILSLPISNLIRLVGKKQMAGALPNLYESIENLNESYMQSNISKESLLKQLSPLSGYLVPFLSLQEAPPQASTNKYFYRCDHCVDMSNYSSAKLRRLGVRDSCNDYYYSDDPRAVCPNCGNAMSRSMTYVAPPAELVEKHHLYSSSGFVKDVVTYMVMDDLTVKPLSAVSSIALLTHFNIKNVSALEEKVVNLGLNEAVKLLKASLESNKVLTHVFLDGNN